MAAGQMIGQYSLFDVQEPEPEPEQAPEKKLKDDDDCMYMYMQCPAVLRGCIRAGCTESFVKSRFLNSRQRISAIADEQGIVMRGIKYSWQQYITVIRKIAEETRGTR